MSINDDYFFAQCLRLNTQINLLDGRILTLQEIIAEHEQGKQNWVYSLNLQTHEMEPGRISWAGVTRRDAQMVRITLDNGKYIDVTPDHRFILRDGSERQAGDLQPDDSLMPLYLREGRTGPRQKNAGYTRYLCNATGKTKFVHTTIQPKPPGRDWVVHHKDFNGFNNNPDNLEVMTWLAHEELHKSVGTYSLGRQWSDKEARQKLMEGMRRLYSEANPEFQQMLSERNALNGAKTWENPETANTVRLKLRENCDIQIEQRRLRHTPELFERVVELYNEGQGDFKTNYAKNHKVVSIELLSYREDTGDITVESESDSHVFALAAGIYVHNSADGRGSKVETLPGGEQTGEITDLMFFSRKLARGLRVPVSYLNLGEDESGGGVTFNDGKLGAAMIQEFRFTKYCMRWQSLLAPIFDKEYKKFLVKNGIEMDWGLFELQFRPPQSFTKYRQIELDSQRVQVYQGVEQNRRLSERFKLIRFLGLTEDELIDNDRMWSEENADKLKKKTGITPAEGNAGDGLSSVGLRPMGDDGMSPDMEMPPEGEMPQEGGPPSGPSAGAAPPTTPMGGTGGPAT